MIIDKIRQVLPMKRLARDVLLNTFCAARIIPEGQRWRLYRLMGLHVGRSGIAPGCYINPGTMRIAIGERTYINMRLTIMGANRIEVGTDVFIGPEVMLAGGGHELGNPQRRAGPLHKGDIFVGDGCWIGARVTILAGAEIGAGCVVAAGAVVTSGTHEPHGLYGGIPATRLRDLSKFV